MPRYFKEILECLQVCLRFEPWQITFPPGTDVPSKMIIVVYQVEGIKSNGELLGYWKYHDEDSLIKVLKEILDIIIPST